MGAPEGAKSPRMSGGSGDGSLLCPVHICEMRRAITALRAVLSSTEPGLRGTWGSCTMTPSPLSAEAWVTVVGGSEGCLVSPEGLGSGWVLSSSRKDRGRTLLAQHLCSQVGVCKWT